MHLPTWAQTLVCRRVLGILLRVMTQLKGTIPDLCLTTVLIFIRLQHPKGLPSWIGLASPEPWLAFHHFVPCCLSRAGFYSAYSYWFDITGPHDKNLVWRCWAEFPWTVGLGDICRPRCAKKPAQLWTEGEQWVVGFFRRTCTQSEGKKKKNIPLDSWAFAHSYRHAPLVLCLLISCLTTDKALLPTVVPKPQSAGTALGWSASLIVRCLLCKPRGWGDFLGVGDGVKTRVFLCGLGCPGALYVSWLASSFCLLNARIKGICHCIQQWFFLQKKKKVLPVF